MVRRGAWALLGLLTVSGVRAADTGFPREEIGDLGDIIAGMALEARDDDTVARLARLHNRLKNWTPPPAPAAALLAASAPAPAPETPGRFRFSLARFCDHVISFRQYTPRAWNLFRPGETTHVYLEIENATQTPVEPRDTQAWAARTCEVSIRLLIQNDKGAVVWDPGEYGVFQPTLYGAVRELHVPVPLAWPEKLEPGHYRLVIMGLDRASGTSTDIRLPFEIGHGQALPRPRGEAGAVATASDAARPEAKAAAGIPAPYVGERTTAAGAPAGAASPLLPLPDSLPLDPLFLDDDALPQQMTALLHNLNRQTEQMTKEMAAMRRTLEESHQRSEQRWIQDRQTEVQRRNLRAGGL